MLATALVICVAALVGIAAAEEPEKYAVWGAIPKSRETNNLSVQRLLRPGKVGSKSAASHPRTANPAA